MPSKNNKKRLTPEQRAIEDKYRDQFSVVCQQTFPAAFNIENPCPLAIGTYQKIRAEFPDVRSRTLSRFMHWWTSRPEYLKAMTEEDALRRNLDGTVDGPVSDDHREFARKRLNGKA